VEHRPGGGKERNQGQKSRLVTAVKGGVGGKKKENEDRSERGQSGGQQGKKTGGSDKGGREVRPQYKLFHSR